MINSEQRSKTELVHENEIDLKSIISVCLGSYREIVVITSIISVFGIIFSLSLPNQYISSAKLAPSDVYKSESSVGGSSALSGLASLAGITAGMDQEMDKTQLAIETVKSRDFFDYFVTKRDLLPKLMFGLGFDQSIQDVKINSEYYDVDTKEWKITPPSSDNAYDTFYSFFDIQKDRRSGVIYMSFQNDNPVIAQKWLNFALEDLNSYLKMQDSQKYMKSVDYLNKKINATNLPDVKKGLVAFILTNTQKLMLTEITDEYAFKIIEEPILPIKKSSPRRSIICILFAITGLFFSIFLIIIFRAFDKKLSVSKNYPFLKSSELI